MRALAAFLVIAAILLGIVGPQAFFVVDETQMAIVTRFGEFRRSITRPGLYVKAPFVDTVTYFDGRLLIFDAPPDSLLTKDKKRLIIDVFARARIVDPRLFREAVRTESIAASRAIDIIASELRREIALDEQSEIIRTSRQEIMERVREAAAPKLAAMGMELVDVRIKRADFPDEIAESIYARMQAERRRIADRERAEGAEQDATIRANVDREATIIKADAEKQANIIRGEGEAEAIKILAEALSQDPEFYAFQRSLDAYRKFLTSNATLVLSADSDLFRFLESPSGVASAVHRDRPTVSTPLVSELMAVELAARKALASTLGDQAALATLTRLERAQWDDGSLGCPATGSTVEEGPIEGFLLTFRHLGKDYQVRVSGDGRLTASC